MSVIFKPIIIAIIMLLQLSACSDKQQADKNLTSPADAVKGKPAEQPYQYEISDPNYLRQRIPAEALAYIRLPQLFAYLSSPKGDIFTRALAQEEHQKLIVPLQEKIYRMLADDSGDLFKPLMAFWLQHTRTPVELIVLSNEHQQPLPRILMSTTLDFDSPTAFAAYLQDLIKHEQNLYLMKDEIAKNGHASLASGPLSVELHYDADSRQLRLLAGMGIDRDMMMKSFARLEVQDKHAMYQAESAIDSSHYGLFVWLNIENILPVAGNMLPPEKNQQIKNSILAEARALSAGIGVSHGKGRLKLIADFNKDALSNTLPAGDMAINLDASGQPRMLAAISMTSASQLKKLEQNLFKQYLGQSTKDYQAFKQKFTEASGVSLEEILAALGPEVLFLQDSLGEYSAIAVRDIALYRQVLERWIKHGKLNYRQNEIDGVTIHYLQTKPWFIPPKKSFGSSANTLLDLLLKARSHAYWIEEDGYLVFAAVPQLLLDRSHYKQKTRVSSWLKQTQKQEAGSALLLASSRVQGSPAKLYYGYLQALLFLSDIAGADIDIARLPSAEDVSLPESGTYGFQLSVSDRQVFAELVYENNPAEFMLGQGMGNVAVVGILAAIAIPAYQDYTVRAKVNHAYAQTLSLRRWIEDYWKQHGKYPAQADIDSYSFADISANSISGIDILPRTGNVLVTLTGHAQIQGKRMTLQPQKTEHGLRWLCRGDLSQKYWPRECR